MGLGGLPLSAPDGPNSQAFDRMLATWTLVERVADEGGGVPGEEPWRARVGGSHVLVSDIRLRNPKGRHVELRSDDLADLSRAVAYGSKSNRAVICILSPFSRLGSSCDFQGVAGLIAVQKSL
jgi:hypothetical protein